MANNKVLFDFRMSGKTYTHIIVSRWKELTNEPIEKSKRRQENENEVYTEKQVFPDNNTQWEFDSVNQDMSNQNDDSSHLGGMTRKINKRDEFNQKLGFRDLHTQVGQNPFLAGESYLQHLNIQESFLRPQNTNTITITPSENS